MTDERMFKDADTISKQNEKIKNLRIKVLNLQGLEKIHRNTNGDLSE